jgi:Flp pilus assembly protein TadG
MGLGRVLRNLSNRRGTTALEYGMLAPVLMLCILGIIDAGRLMWEYNSLLHGAAAAARCGAVDQNNCMTGAQIKAYAATQTWGSLVSAPYYGVTFTSCGVLVQARIQIWLYTPGLPNFILTPSVCEPTLFNAYNRG